MLPAIATINRGKNQPPLSFIIPPKTSIQQKVNRQPKITIISSRHLRPFFSWSLNKNSSTSYLVIFPPAKNSSNLMEEYFPHSSFVKY